MDPKMEKAALGRHVRAVYPIGCSCCGRVDTTEGFYPRKGHYINIYHQRGWRRHKGKTCCPDCARKRELL